MSQEADYSQEIAREIDEEIRRIIEEAHERARQVLSDNRDLLDLTSKILLERETIDRNQFLRLIDGENEESVFAEADRKAAEKARELEQKPTERESEPRSRGLNLPLPGTPEPPPAGA